MGKNQSASGLTNIIQYDNKGNVSFVSGSTTLMQISSSGAITTTGVISGSNALSASYALNSGLLNSTGSVGFATTGSLLIISSSQQQISASQQQISASFLILTASFNAVSASQQQISSSQEQISASLLNVIAIGATTGSNSFRATQSITGSLTVTGQIIAQTLNVQQVTSSIIYSSGSNNFGCDLNSIQTFTGSVLVTGSLTIAGASSAASYSGTTIYGSTAVCSAVGKFTTCIDITSVTTTGTALRINGDNLTTGTALSIISNDGSASHTGNLVEICNAFNAGATAKLMCLYQGDDGDGIYINMARGGVGLTVDGAGGGYSAIFNNGNVGIGTATPGGVLDAGCSVFDATTIFRRKSQTGDAGWTALRLVSEKTTAAGAGFGTAISFLITDSVNTNCSLADLVVERDGSNFCGAYSFRTYAGSGNGIERMRITSAGIATFACQVCISIGRTNGADSTALIFQDNTTGVQTPGFGLRLAYQSNGTGVQSVIGLENGGTGTNNESQISFYTQNVAGGLAKRLLLTSGGDAGFSGNVCAASFSASNPSLTRSNLNIDRATKVITSFNATASGARWLRVGCFNARTTYLMSFGTTGNYYTPGSTTFLMFRDWGNGFFTSTLGKLGEQYVFCTRFQSDNVGDTYALEVWMNSITADQLNGVLVYSAATLAGNPDSILMCLGSYGTSLANAANTSTAIAL